MPVKPARSSEIDIQNFEVAVGVLRTLAKLARGRENPSAARK